MGLYIRNVLHCILALWFSQHTLGSVTRGSEVYTPKTSRENLHHIDEIIKIAKNIPDNRFTSDIKLIQVQGSDYVRYYMETNKDEAVFTRSEFDTIGRSLIVFKSPDEDFEEDVYIVLKHVPDESNLYYISKVYIRDQPEFSIEWDEWEYNPRYHEIQKVTSRPGLEIKMFTQKYYECSVGKCSSKDYKLQGTTNHLRRTTRGIEDAVTSGYGWSDYPIVPGDRMNEKPDPPLVNVKDKKGNSSSSKTAENVVHSSTWKPVTTVEATRGPSELIKTEANVKPNIPSTIPPTVPIPPSDISGGGSKNGMSGRNLNRINATTVPSSPEECNTTKYVVANAKKDADSIGAAQASALSKGCASAIANARNGEKATANAVSLKGNAIASSKTAGGMGSESNAMTKGSGNSSASAISEGKGHSKSASISDDGHAHAQSVSLNGSNAQAYSRTNGSQGTSLADSKSTGGNSQSVAMASDGAARSSSSAIGGNAQSVSTSNGSAGAKSLSTSFGGNARSDAMSAGDGDAHAIALGGDDDAAAAGDAKFFDDMPEFSMGDDGKNRTKRNVQDGVTCDSFDWNLDNEFKYNDQLKPKIKSDFKTVEEPTQEKWCTICKKMSISSRKAILKKFPSKKFREDDKMGDSMGNPKNSKNDNDGQSSFKPNINLNPAIRKGRLGIKPQEFYASILDSSLNNESPDLSGLTVPILWNKEHLNFISNESFIGKRVCTEPSDKSSLKANSVLNILIKLNLKCDKNAVETLDMLLKSRVLVSTTFRDHPILEILKISPLTQETKLSKKEIQLLVSSILISTYSHAVANYRHDDFSRDGYNSLKTSLDEPISRSMSTVVSMLTDAVKLAHRNVKKHEIKLLRAYIMTGKKSLSAAINDSYIVQRDKHHTQSELSMSSTHIKVIVGLIEFIKYGTQYLGDDVNSVKTFWNFYKSHYNSIAKISKCIFSPKKVVL